MRNVLFVLFIFLNFFCLTKCNQSVVNDINYYVYFIRDKNVIVCSNKERENLNFSKVETTSNNKGFECLIDLKHDGIFKLSLKMMSLLFNPENSLYEALDDQTTKNLFKHVNIKIGLNDIQDDDMNQTVEANSIQLVIKLNKGILSFTTDSSCNKNSDDENSCNFVTIDDGIIDTKYLKLNFDFIPSPRQFSFILLEQQVNVTSSDCNSTCVNGTCSEGSCYCKNGYMGENCESCKNKKNKI